MLQSASQGGVWAWGGAWFGGVSAPGGSGPGGVSALWRGGGSGARGVPGQGDLPPGGCLVLGVSQHALRQTPLPPCGQTHACKNITLAQLRCGR